MIFIFISILFNAYIGIIFKYFGKWNINGQVAIVVNYFCCVLTGIFLLGKSPFGVEQIQSSWFPWSIVVGLLLIMLFNVMSMASVKIGITLTQAANKMSLALPVLFSFYLYNEEISLLKIAGIAVALIGVYFVTRSKQTETNRNKKYWWLLPALFLGSGALDTITKYVENSFIASNQSLNFYLIHSFAAAAVLGSIFLLSQVLQKKIIMDKRSLLAGILLGIPNYFSIYFLIKAFQYKGLSSSAIIPINNIGILIMVTLYGFIIFNEKLSAKNKIGLGLAILSILLLISS